MKFSLTKALQEFEQKFGNFKSPIIATMFYITLTAEKVSQITAILIIVFLYFIPCMILNLEKEREKRKESEKK